MGISSTSQGRPDTAADVLTAARARRRAADAAEADLMELAVDWASMHSPDSVHHRAGHAVRGFGQTDLALAGAGAPTIAEFAVAEFAAAVGLSTEAGKGFLGEALELCFRLPAQWRRVASGELPAWKARRVARETIRLAADAAAYVDTHVAPVAHQVKPAQLDRAVDEAIGRFMPAEVERLAEQSWDKRHVTLCDQLVSFTGTMRLEAELDIADALDFGAAVAAGAAQRESLGSTEPLDVRRAEAVGDLARRQLALDLGRPLDDAGRAPPAKPRRVVLLVHLSESAVLGLDDPVARLERGDALVSVAQVRAWCGNVDTEVVVKPVIDLAACLSTDSDQVPPAIAERVALRDRTCVFPWCTRPARRCRPDDPGDHPCDDDHVVARARGGPTCSCNLAPCVGATTGSRRMRRGATSWSTRAPICGPARTGTSSSVTRPALSTSAMTGRGVSRAYPPIPLGLPTPDHLAPHAAPPEPGRRRARA
jgi:hypothetical protein